jgi:hypothetical protein
MHNRGEWASKGQNVVQQYLEEFERKIQEESIVKAQSSRVQI